jgi:hypothetical protein
MTKVERGRRGQQLSEIRHGVRKNARPADGSARRGGKAGRTARRTRRSMTCMDPPPHMTAGSTRRKPSKTATIVMSLIKV